MVPNTRTALLLVLLSLCTQDVHTLQSHKTSNKQPTKVRWLGCHLPTCSAPLPPQTEELRDRMLDSKDGVISFDNDDFSTYVEAEERPYALIIMATARHLMDKQQLGLRVLRKNFGLVARALQQDVLAQQKQGGGDFDKVHESETHESETHESEIHESETNPVVGPSPTHLRRLFFWCSSSSATHSNHLPV